MDGKKRKRQKSCKTPSPRRWLNLPAEILANIGKRMITRVNCIQFRSVCSTWRKSLPVPASSGILSPILPIEIPNSEKLPFVTRSNDPVILMASAVFVVETTPQSSNSPWLLTVEEREQGKLRVLYPLSTEPVMHLPSNFPKYLDLSEYRVTEVARYYSLKYVSDGEDVLDNNSRKEDYYARGVVLCPNHDSTALVGDTVMVLYGKGNLVGVRLRNGKWSYVRKSLLSPFRGVFYCKGAICATTRDGILYKIDHDSMKVCRMISTPGIPRYFIDLSYPDLIVESNGELLLVGWDSSRSWEKPCIYKLNERIGQWECKEDTGNEMLFLSFKWCFLVPSLHPQRPTGMCITYSKQIFEDKPVTKSLFHGECDDLGIHMFLSCEDCAESLRPPSLPNSIENLVARMMWPPPTWFWPDAYTSSSDSMNEEEESESDDSDKEDSDSTSDDEESDDSDEEDSDDSDEEDSDYMSDDGASDSQNDQVPPPREHDQEQTGALSQRNIPTRLGISKDDQVSSKKLLPLAHVSQNSGNDVSVTEFEGLKIRSNLVPTLRQVWSKRGNIVENCRVRNVDIKAHALEALATVILVLERNSASSLSDDQAEYLKSTLHDLEHMGIRVDWLAPLIKRDVTRRQLKPTCQIKSQAQPQLSKMNDELKKILAVYRNMKPL